MKEKEGWGGGAIKTFKLLGFNSAKLHATDTTGHIHTENSAGMLIKYFVMKGANLTVDPTTSTGKMIHKSGAVHTTNVNRIHSVCDSHPKFIRIFERRSLGYVLRLHSDDVFIIREIISG